MNNYFPPASFLFYIFWAENELLFREATKLKGSGFFCR